MGYFHGLGDIVQQYLKKATRRGRTSLWAELSLLPVVGEAFISGLVVFVLSVLLQPEN